ncbi:unnamed protein product [Trichogramma brassicae]|uniref:Uncharacterized protein n=1 Tax=Trichogramma brassicae TaxID=86971 RepID=A0A6H5J911_9HYME|nr:unnamed protein product [Trichogramma brassicae]
MCVVTRRDKLSSRFARYVLSRPRALHRFSVLSLSRGVCGFTQIVLHLRIVAAVSGYRGKLLFDLPSAVVNMCTDLSPRDAHRVIYIYKFIIYCTYAQGNLVKDRDDQFPTYLYCEWRSCAEHNAISRIGLYHYHLQPRATDPLWFNADKPIDDDESQVAAMELEFEAWRGSEEEEEEEEEEEGEGEEEEDSDTHEEEEEELDDIDMEVSYSHPQQRSSPADTSTDQVVIRMVCATKRSIGCATDRRQDMSRGIDSGGRILAFRSRRATSHELESGRRSNCLYGVRETQSQLPISQLSCASLTRRRRRAYLAMGFHGGGGSGGAFARNARNECAKHDCANPSFISRYPKCANYRVPISTAAPNVHCLCTGGRLVNSWSWSSSSSAFNDRNSDHNRCVHLVRANLRREGHRGEKHPLSEVNKKLRYRIGTQITIGAH